MQAQSFTTESWTVSTVCWVAIPLQVLKLLFTNRIFFESHNNRSESQWPARLWDSPDWDNRGRGTEWPTEKLGSSGLRALRRTSSRETQHRRVLASLNSSSISGYPCLWLMYSVHWTGGSALLFPQIWGDGVLDRAVFMPTIHILQLPLLWGGSEDADADEGNWGEPEVI